MPESNSNFAALVSMLILLETILTQGCLQPADTQDRSIPFDSATSLQRPPRLPSGSQAIITSYQFQCCGNITEWQTYVEPGGSKHRNGVYSITFQVWRPSTTVATDGCYSLVGENVFSEITLLDHGLVSETPTPTNIISVQPGDVVGYYAASDNFGRNEGIILDDSYTDESVWYLTEDGPPLESNGETCPLPVGPSGVLSSSTNAAPVLSVSLDTFGCPSLQPSPEPSPEPSSELSTTPTSEPSPAVSTLIAASTASTIHQAITSTYLPTEQSATSQVTSQVTLPIILNGANNGIKIGIGTVIGLVAVMAIISAAAIVVACTAIIRRRSENRRREMLKVEIQENHAYSNTSYATVVPNHTQSPDLELYASIDEDVVDMKMQENEAYSSNEVEHSESYTTDISKAFNAYAIHTFHEYDYVK